VTRIRFATICAGIGLSIGVALSLRSLVSPGAAEAQPVQQCPGPNCQSGRPYNLNGCQLAPNGIIVCDGGVFANAVELLDQGNTSEGCIFQTTNSTSGFPFMTMACDGGSTNTGYGSAFLVTASQEDWAGVTGASVFFGSGVGTGGQTGTGSDPYVSSYQEGGNAGFAAFTTGNGVVCTNPTNGYTCVYPNDPLDADVNGNTSSLLSHSIAGCKLSKNGSGQLVSTCPVNFTGAGGWQTALDCNFATAPLQVLPNTDGGSFSACGVTWYRTAVNFSGGTDAIDAGLIMKCSTTGASGLPSVCDGVYIPLASIISNFSGQVPLRITTWIQNPTTVGISTNQYESVAVDNFPVSTETGAVESTSTFFRELSGWVIQDEPSTSSDTFADTTVPSGLNVAGLYFPDGLGVSLHEFYVALYDGGLPPLGGDIPLMWQGQNGNATANAYKQGPPANYGAFLSCVGSGTGTTVANFGRIKIEYKQ
jgi:hypothetical protein